MIPLVLCDKCRKPMSAVRPGKWQCDCETAGMLRMTDEELVLRELDEWLAEDGNDVAEYGRRVVSAVRAVRDRMPKMTDGDVENIVGDTYADLRDRYAIASWVKVADFGIACARAVRDFYEKGETK